MRTPRANNASGRGRAALAVTLPAAHFAGHGAAPAAAQAPGCRFILGFAALRDLIRPQIVGQCLEEQRFAANGDAVQQTSGGMLAWREADNWTAFTDGAQTWINGPQVLAQRPNTTRFPWEGDGVMMQGNRFAPAERAVAASVALTWVDLDRVSAVMAPPDQLNVTAPSGG